MSTTEEQAGPRIGSNGLPHCCEAEPTLRIRETVIYGATLPFVQYECRRCGTQGGKGITEREAAQMWRQKCE